MSEKLIKTEFIQLKLCAFFAVCLIIISDEKPVRKKFSQPKTTMNKVQYAWLHLLEQQHKNARQETPFFALWSHTFWFLHLLSTLLLYYVLLHILFCFII